MPKSTKHKLAYQKAYNEQPEQKEAGVERRRARRQAIREGIVDIGDGKDLAHKKPMSEGGSTTKKNLKVETAKKNRAWRKNRGYNVPTDA